MMRVKRLLRLGHLEVRCTVLDDGALVPCVGVALSEHGQTRDCKSNVDKAIQAVVHLRVFGAKGRPQNRCQSFLLYSPPPAPTIGAVLSDKEHAPGMARFCVCKRSRHHHLVLGTRCTARCTRGTWCGTSNGGGSMFKYSTVVARGG